MIAHFEVDVVQFLTGPQKKNEVHFEPMTMEPSPSTTVAMGRWHSRSVSRNTALSESGNEQGTCGLSSKHSPHLADDGQRRNEEREYHSDFL